jgi:hypothetical protein
MLSPREYFVTELPALLSVDEAAERLGRSPQAVRSMPASRRVRPCCSTCSKTTIRARAAKQPGRLGRDERDRTPCRPSRMHRSMGFPEEMEETEYAKLMEQYVQDRADEDRVGDGSPQ